VNCGQCIPALSGGQQRPNALPITQQLLQDMQWSALLNGCAIGNINRLEQYNKKIVVCSARRTAASLLSSARYLTISQCLHGADIMNRILRIFLTLLIGALAGCAAPGSIVPNTTTADELVRKLGKPSDTRPNPQGGELWDYVYGPEGVTTWRYAVDAKRMVRSADQLITHERLYKVVPGVTTEAGVIELLGRPRLISRYGHETAWEWRVSLTGEMGIFVVRFTHDGIALGVSVQKDIYIDGDRGNP
jgi:hypothetical protein